MTIAASTAKDIVHTPRKTTAPKTPGATIRQPAVAGMFYPADPDELSAMVVDFLEQARSEEPPPKAIIAPHAGYIYSGPIAASAFARLRNLEQAITRVVVLGPAHRVGFYGIAASGADYFQTPLGLIPLDRDAIESIVHLSEVFTYDLAHEQEHSLEVQLPFLQETLGDFALVPLVVGSASPKEVADVIEALWGGPETLIVVSSDLSHYLDYYAARSIDVKTSKSIEALRYEEIQPEQACGRIPVQGLLSVARKYGMSCANVDLRNSGDTAGPREQVVGYGAYVCE